ncbi:FAD-binding oxidoreductase [Draconibacterium sp. IB214405]|uniref:ferredoxin--NADP reductase n=1 Tax=Draconibacterium sp. IB214405 TaxID=3097352 RepID=UPI002A171DF9|nr:FAD-binding oxidoreductase [Draconibacterium sp. IB214405]MDX8338840.1 FAD-binding oxidoreductase [Draconibacterium sp. IB214405]
MKKHKVTQVRHLTDSTFVIRFERNGMEFQTGQFVLLGIKGAVDRREYSIYSGEHDDYLEVLVREVEGGKVSSKLKKLKAGDLVDVDGPFGFFKFDPQSFQVQKFLFIATGTGISPFHGFVKTHPQLNYKMVHGVRKAEEAYDHVDFNKERVTLCASGEKGGDFHGRVTEFLKTETIDENTNCFLCGNSEMIYEVFDILSEKGIPTSNIYTEVYF